MDAEQQVQLKFLEEAEDCLDQIESILLELANTDANPQDLDRALRFAHSMKGGAAMMGFMSFSRIAHRVEDFFKILRLRFYAQPIGTEVETLLLQSIDCLRQLSELHRQGANIDEAWLSEHTQPIFVQLQSYLGELRPEDEDALLAQEEDVDPALLMFEDGVETAIKRLEAQISELFPTDLRQEVKRTAEELADFGRMAGLESFVQLCLSVMAQVDRVSVDEVGFISQQAQKLWKKSLSLVILRRLDSLPTQLLETDTTLDNLTASSLNDDLTSAGPEETVSFDFPDDTSFDIAAAQAAIMQFDSQFDNSEMDDELLLNEPNLDKSVLQPLALSDLDLTDALAAVELSELVAEMNAIELPVIDEIGEIEYKHPEPEQPVMPLPEPEHTQPTAKLLQQLAQNAASKSATTTIQTPLSPPSTTEPQQTVRIPVEYLQQFNTIFGQLILERNAINLRLAQMQGFNKLLRERMQRLEKSNQQLRRWYDRASIEGLIPTAVGVSQADETVSQRAVGLDTALNSFERFDALEMDRYGDLHLVSQAQIETIMQLQEVTADIDLSLREMTESVRDLNQTTRSLQSNVTRTQMVPFADVVRRFPRLIRDLSVQFGKPVNLKIIGEGTLIDRSILQQLSDPLLHLLRNAFDHGLETAAERRASQKTTEGQITLEAASKGGKTVITLTDDGRGIQLDKIRSRLQEMGLSPEIIQEMGEPELLDMIFEPGFSTATAITELSGRGVGMDVVRTNLQKLRGAVSVSTQEGLGTKFTMQLPFTLSILRIMLLERAGLVFAVAVDSVREIIHLLPDQISPDGSIPWQGHRIPALQLEQHLSFRRPTKPFELSGTPTIAKPTVLVVGDGDALFGFSIDRFWGEQEVTLRSIESPMPLPPGFNSSILLGDGRVVPLIDLIQVAAWVTAAPLQVLVSTHPTERGFTAFPTAFSAQEQPNTILVVDDSINVRQYLALTLEKAGYQVEQAKDGQDAVDRLMGGLQVSAVVCDIEMPRLDGYGVLETLRGQAKFADLPIIMLTSRSSDKHRKLAMNLGASAYFSKPYTEQELLQTLRELIAS
jgi:two-component system, chemotaxis family, sensor histidine kinase and response regulator PixL